VWWAALASVSVPRGAGEGEGDEYVRGTAITVRFLAVTEPSGSQ
jgi:hypothetical protein